jgi:hypothetical protein
MKLTVEQFARVATIKQAVKTINEDIQLLPSRPFAAVSPKRVLEDYRATLCREAVEIAGHQWQNLEALNPLS